MDSKEQKLIKDCLKGDLKPFGEIYKIYIDKIYRFIYFKTHHKETAEDLVSQTFFKALRSVKDFNPDKGEFSSWLYRIAKNCVIDHYRTRKSEVDIYDIWDLADKQDIGRDSELKDKLEQAGKYLKNLPGEQRDIILMRAWSDMPYKEIAEIIGKSEDNCKMIFSRAINKLRKEEFLTLLVLLSLTKII
jgi:RNA polymerase sigma-70 factor (ECF subfamily)